MILLVGTLFLSQLASANEIHIVQGAAAGASLGGGVSVLWSTDALFLNRGSSTATVRLLGVSNGGWMRGTPTLELLPQRTASLSRTVGGNLAPTQPAILWVVRAEVPPEVQVESLLFIGSSFTSPGPGNQSPYRFGKARLPVFDALIPANQPQFHLGTFLGDPQDIPSRLNVAVYNAAGVQATALIQIRQHCDDSIIDSRTVTVPPDTLLQFGGFVNTEQGCPQPATGTLGGPPNAVYTVVTVDQPSISFVSNLANREIPTTSIAVTTSEH